MALKATIYKAELQIADMDRGYYGNHSLTLARHPSETDERMMVRLLAFALHAHESLVFADSIGTEDMPSLWQKDLTGAIEVWIDVGQPDEKRIRKACGRARQMFIYSYGGHSADVWLNQISRSLERSGNVTVINLPTTVIPALVQLARRSMQLQFIIQDKQIWVTQDNETIHVDLTSATILSR